MKESTAYVGLDVHKDSITVAFSLEHAEPMDFTQIVNEPAAVAKMVGRLARQHRDLKFAYEAGPCGYDLHRQLLAMGHSCIVVAPSLIPRRPGDRVKTDRRDARTLARLLRSGDLTSVWVPDPPHEAIRELVRCREDFKHVERRCRQQLCALLLRHGRHYEKSNWTQEHRKWLLGQKFDNQTQLVFDHYLHAIIEAEQRILNLERQMEESLPGWSLRKFVGGLMAMRGIKLVTAMTYAAELGDITRFARPGELMSFVGVVPSEFSSGQTRRQGRITKSGNRHVRRVLVESSWAYRHKPGISASLRARSRDASPAVQAIAWKAQKRLCSRYHRLIARGKSPQTAVTAVAREQLGFIWAIGQKVMEEQRTPAPAGV
jgi:transposase